MRFKRYITEKTTIDLNKIKAEIAKLKKGKLTDLGKRKLDRLENILMQYGIFEGMKLPRLNEAKVLKPIKPKEDKKSWDQLDPYEQKKLKAYLKKQGIKVLRILGKVGSTNYAGERQVTVNLEDFNYDYLSFNINLKTGKITEEEWIYAK